MHKYTNAKDSFIFLFTDRNISTSYTSDGQQPMYCSNDYGPAFGSNSNLYCYNNNGACLALEYTQ